MSWLLNVTMDASCLKTREFPIDYLKCEGGANRGFLNGQNIENNMTIIDEFEDAKTYKNLIIGSKTNNFSMELYQLTKSEGGFDSAILNVRCISPNSKIVKQISLQMLEVLVKPEGSSTVGQFTVETYKFTFYQANYFLK